MTETIITAIITALCTGGLTWLFTLRYTRKQAEADAMKSVQEVYQELIEDMKNDRKELKQRIGDVENQYRELQQKCNEMEKDIRQNARVMDIMKPFLCGVKNCLNRKSITFDTTNNSRLNKHETWNHTLTYFYLFCSLFLRLSFSSLCYTKNDYRSNWRRKTNNY